MISVMFLFETSSLDETQLERFVFVNLGFIPEKLVQYVYVCEDVKFPFLKKTS